MGLFEGSFGHAIGRNEGMVARQPPGTWATLSEELEGMGWQNLGKLQQQHGEEDVAGPTGFSLLDLLKV